jgi:histidine triad (HIT) family protein
MSKTIFEKIIDREISADIILETENLLAFRDTHPEAPVHILVIPKKHFPRLAAVPTEESELLGQLLLAAQACAKKVGIESTGYRLVINNGADAGETVPHLHVHLLGGRKLECPPG